MGKPNETHKLASDLFNAMPQEDRHKAGLGYSLAQLITIKQLRAKNREALKAYDKKLADWQENIEWHIERDYLAPQKKESKV